jgi:hypothetical protein
MSVTPDCKRESFVGCGRNYVLTAATLVARNANVAIMPPVVGGIWRRLRLVEGRDLE